MRSLSEGDKIVAYRGIRKKIIAKQNETLKKLLDKVRSVAQMIFYLAMLGGNLCIFGLLISVWTKLDFGIYKGLIMLMVIAGVNISIFGYGYWSSCEDKK